MRKTVFAHIWLVDILYSNEFNNNYWNVVFEEKLPMIKNPETTSLVLDLAGELIDVRTQEENIQNFINRTKQENPEIKIILVFNSFMVESFVNGDLQRWDLKFDHVDDTIFANYLLCYYWSILTKQTSHVNSEWNPNNDKLLMLIRRPLAEQRLGLFRQLVERGFEDELNWSLTTIEKAETYFLNMNKEQYVERCQEYLPGSDLEEVREFLEKYGRIFGEIKTGTVATNPELPSVTVTEETVKQMYSTVIGEVVSESRYNTYDPLLVSEKTFKPIANHMPFINVGPEPIEDYLREYGFYTFDLDNVEKLENQNLTTLLQNGLDTNIFFQKSFMANRFAEFYKTFRDDSWPEEVRWNELGSLSYKIQEEIITNFFSPAEIRGALRMQTLINRILSFKETLINNKEEVSQMVKHNADRFNELGEEMLSTINEIIIKHNLDYQNSIEFVNDLYEKPPADTLSGIHEDYVPDRFKKLPRINKNDSGN